MTTASHPVRHRFAGRSDVERFLGGLEATTPAGLRGPRALDRPRLLLELLDSPQDRFPAIHVAGTAGKGSVVTYIAAMLHAHGHTVGAHLSPHVRSVAERFQMDGRAAHGSALARAAEPVADAAGVLSATHFGRPSYFEATNAIAFRLFAELPVDYGVVETGIGGLLDATNTISRRDKLAVLTTIGLDHTELLGDTVSAIARQKAGILPIGGRAVVLRGGPEVDGAVGSVAAERGCEVDWFDPGSAMTEIVRGPDGCFSGRVVEHGGRLRPAIPGRHQLDNAALALRVVHTLAERDGWHVDRNIVEAAVASVTLPGRFQLIRWRDRDLVLDGAHNATKLSALVAALDARWPGRQFAWLVGMRQDKDVAAALSVLAPYASGVVATEPELEGGDHAITCPVPAEVIARCARRAGVPVTVAEPDPTRALERACAFGDTVVVSGSFRLVGIVASVLGGGSDT